MSIETLANVRRDAAADWIDANQIGRRNLTHDQIAIIIGRRYLRSKKRHGAEPGTRRVSAQNEHLQKTAEQIAQEHHVGQATVRRAAAFVRAVEQLKDVDPTLERKVTEGTAGTVLKSDSGPMEPRETLFKNRKERAGVKTQGRHDTGPGRTRDSTAHSLPPPNYPSKGIVNTTARITSPSWKKVLTAS